MKQGIPRSVLTLCIFAVPPLVAGAVERDADHPPAVNEVEGSTSNIIFIFADDWGYGDMGKHGSTFCQTPHLDRMAEQGVDFANFTVNASVCTPSRVAVMTGQFPSRQCIYQHFAGLKSNAQRGMPDWMDPQGPSLARMLQQAGYETGHFGKWHLGAGAGVPTEDLCGVVRSGEGLGREKERGRRES